MSKSGLSSSRSGFVGSVKILCPSRTSILLRDESLLPVTKYPAVATPSESIPRTIPLPKYFGNSIIPPQNWSEKCLLYNDYENKKETKISENREASTLAYPSSCGSNLCRIPLGLLSA